MNLIRRLWTRLTYWPVPCESCKGTGICQTLQAGAPPSVPHSCCGDCARVVVPATCVPAGFARHDETTVIVGNGVMWRRPWSKRQVLMPWKTR